MNKIFYIKTFGCQMNFNDSLKISNLLVKENFIKNKKIKNSNILIINTCSIRDNCHNKLYKYIEKTYKKYKYLLFIIVGCISNFLANFLINKFNFIKIVLGTQGFYYIKFLIKMYYYYNCKQINIGFLKNNLYNNYNKNNLNTNCITITEGCNKYCSYCIVPFTRGKEISFYLNIILFKILRLKYNYIYLLGQNVTSYYSKINEFSNKLIKFNILLSYISQIFNIKYINYISANPQDYDEYLINIFILNKKLPSLIHLPIQSCSNRILNLMRRNYNLNKIKNIIYNIKYIRKDIYISSDFIICFYNENNCDFYKTLIFIEKFLFDKSYIFLYSPRPYTKSYYFNYNIPFCIKNKRFNFIKYKIKNNIFYLNKLMLGKIETIFIENYFFYKNNTFLCLTNNNRVVYFSFDKNFYILKKFLKIKIINIYNNIFYGIILNLNE